MPRRNRHASVRRSYLTHMLLRGLADPDAEPDSEELTQQLVEDLRILERIKNTRYLRSRTPVAKSGNLHLAFEYSQNPADHDRFLNMLRVSPQVFHVLLGLIEDNPVFFNNSNNPQTPVEMQLAVTLFRMGRFGNGASLEDIARTSGFSEGSVLDFTDRCFDAIEALHDVFVRPLSAEEKEAEKRWMVNHLGYDGGLFKEGWVMYDGTIVVLYEKPGLNGDAYYTRKGNYGLNAQIGNVPSNLRIVDYAHGMTGSAHDAAAFEHTAASKFPDWFFEGEEFAWGDSAYPVNERIVSIHKKPASLRPENALFDKTVSRLRVRSEHCMGALKGRFQCLRGLRVNIMSNEDHVAACRWITIAIILHNLVIEVEGANAGGQFMGEHTRAQELVDRGQPHREGGILANSKRERLVAEIVAAKGM